MLSKFRTRAGLLRRQLKPNIRKLTVTAALLFVTAFHFDAFANRFAVRNGWIFELQLKTVFPLQLFCQNLKLHFSHAHDGRLVRLLAIVHGKGRFLIAFLLKCGDDFFAMLLIRHINGKLQSGFRHLYRFIIDRIVLSRKCVTGLYAVKLFKNTDIACRSGRQLYFICAAHGQKLADADSFVGVCVEIGTFPAHRAGENPQKTPPPFHRAHRRLEDLRRKSAFCRALFKLARLWILADGRLEVWRRHIAYEIVHHLHNTDILLRRTTEDWENLARLYAFDQCCLNFNFCNLFTIDVLFQKFVIKFCNGFNQESARSIDILLNIGGNLCLRRRSIVRHNLDMERKQVGNTLEGRRLTDRHLYRNDALTKAYAKLFDNTIEIRMLTIHLIDEERARHIHLIGILPEIFCADLDAGNRRNQNQCTIGRSKGTLNIRNEIGKARRVEKVQFIPLPLTGGKLQRNRHLMPCFLCRSIQCACALFHVSLTADGTRIKKAGIQKRRLSCLSMTDDRYVAKVCARIIFHSVFLPASIL